LIRLGEVGIDGTRVKANNSRYRTLTANTLEEKLQALDALFEQMMAELRANDDQQAGPDSPTHLPPCGSRSAAASQASSSDARSGSDG
jgi:hypothetical protein